MLFVSVCLFVFMAASGVVLLGGGMSYEVRTQSFSAFSELFRMWLLNFSLRRVLQRNGNHALNSLFSVLFS
jgi:fructose-bisphosphate aldolase class 1